MAVASSPLATSSSSSPSSSPLPLPLPLPLYGTLRATQGPAASVTLRLLPSAERCGQGLTSVRLPARGCADGGAAVTAPATIASAPGASTRNRLAAAPAKPRAEAKMAPRRGPVKRGAEQPYADCVHRRLQVGQPAHCHYGYAGSEFRQDARVKREVIHGIGPVVLRAAVGRINGVLLQKAIHNVRFLSACAQPGWYR
jgi:hypothetical protein